MNLDNNNITYCDPQLFVDIQVNQKLISLNAALIHFTNIILQFVFISIFCTSSSPMQLLWIKIRWINFGKKLLRKLKLKRDSVKTNAVKMISIWIHNFPFKAQINPLIKNFGYNELIHSAVRLVYVLNKELLLWGWVGIHKTSYANS